MNEQGWANAGVEPGLWEVLADPIVKSLMKADGITRREVLSASARLMDGPPLDEQRAAAGRAQGALRLGVTMTA